MVNYNTTLIYPVQTYPSSTDPTPNTPLPIYPTYNGVKIDTGSSIPITVTNGQTSIVNLVWMGFYNVAPYPYGGPSLITVACNSDGTGTITGIDRGTFGPDYQPIMAAVAGANPTFMQAGTSGGLYAFPIPLPATGGLITLSFANPQ